MSWMGGAHHIVPCPGFASADLNVPVKGGCYWPIFLANLFYPVQTKTVNLSQTVFQ